MFMKNLFIAFALFISIPLFSQTWELQKPLPQGHNLNCVYFIDPNHGFTLGDYGASLEYTSGDQWLVKNNITFHPSMNDISFVNATHGWAVGSSGRILKYNGNKWNTQVSFTFKDLNGVSFVDNNHGWAVGNNNTIFRCYYGLWYPENSPLTTDYIDLHDVFFVNDTTGWAVGENGTSLKRTSGGWAKDSVPITNSLNAVHFTDPAHGWAVGEDGVVLKYRSQGTPHWTTYNFGNWIDFTDVYFTDSLNGWIIGNNGAVIRYKNGYLGSLQYLDFGYSAYNSVYFSDTANGWIVGDGGIICRYSNGAWTQQSKLAQNGYVYYNIDMLDSTFGIAVPNSWGDKIKILMYDGEEWNQDTTTINYSFVDIDCLDRNYAYAVGNYWSGSLNSGRIAYYHNNTWSLVASPSVELFSISALDTNYAWAVGRDGFIIQRTDYGWNAVANPTQQDLYKVQTYNKHFAMAIGDSGTIIKYNGSQWEIMNNTPNTEIRSLFILDTLNAWVGDDEGDLYKWNGSTWNYQATLRNNEPIYDICFFDSTHGLAAIWGKLGIYNGSTWTLVDYPFDIKQANTVQLTDKKNAWLTGQVDNNENGGSSTGCIFKVTLNDQPSFISDNTHAKNRSTIYPNPFNQSTTIEFALNEKQKVNLTILDASGKIISTLLNKNLPVGDYKIPVNAKDYKQGVYYYNLKIGNIKEVNKMIIVK